MVENYYRVKATEAIEEGMKKAEQNKFEEAQKGIETMIHSIGNNKKVRKEKMQHLVEDLEKVQKKCNHSDWHGGGGQKWAQNAAHSNMQMNNYAYSNQMQQAMVNNVKAKKKMWFQYPLSLLFID